MIPNEGGPTAVDVEATLWPAAENGPPRGSRVLGFWNERGMVLRTRVGVRLTSR